MNTLSTYCKLFYFFIWMLFFIFLYKIYYGEYHKRVGYNINGNSPVSEIHRYSIITYCLFAFLFDSLSIVPDHYGMCGAAFVISYNIVDLTYFKNGETNKLWVLHHTITILGFIGTLYCHTYYIQWQMMCLFEFGSTFFVYQLENQTIREQPLLRALFVVVYVFTRLINCFMLYQFIACILFNEENYFSLMEKLGYSLWMFCNVIAILLNLWFANQSRKSILRQLKRIKQNI